MAKQVAGFVLGFAVLFAMGVQRSDAQGVKVGGYLQAWYLSAQTPGVKGDPGVDSSDNGYRIRRARLNFKSDLNEVFSIDTWFEFAGSTNILLDFKGIAKISPQFVVTVGQFIPPVQMNENANIASSKIPFYELSDLAINLSNFMGTESYRDIGLMVGGQYDIVKYGLYYGNGRGRFNSTLPGSTTAGTILNRKFGQGLWGGRVDIEPTKGLFIGGHYSINKQDSIRVVGSNPLSLDRNSYSFNVGVDGLAEAPNLFADIEYGNGKVKDGNAFDYNGFYATVGYKVTPGLQLLARYDTYNVNTNAVGSTPATSTKAMNWTFGGTYYFYKETTELVKVGLNYEIRNEDPTDIHNNIFVLWTQFRF